LDENVLFCENQLEVSNIEEKMELTP